MTDIFRLAAVLGVFLGIFLSLAFTLRLIVRLRLPSPISQIVLSVTIGLIFGLGSLGLISLSEKFSNWTFTAKLIYAAKMSIYVFISALILSSIKTNKQNESK
jgi:hypothetical protein